MNRKMILIFTCLWIIAFSFIIHSQNKPNIHNATISDLNSVQSIGDVLSKEIHSYVNLYNIDTVEALKGHIDYLGDTSDQDCFSKYSMGTTDEFLAKIAKPVGPAVPVGPAARDARFVSIRLIAAKITSARDRRTTAAATARCAARRALPAATANASRLASRRRA